MKVNKGDVQVDYYKFTERHSPFAGVFIIMLSLRLPSPLIVEAVI